MPNALKKKPTDIAILAAKEHHRPRTYECHYSPPSSEYRLDHMLHGSIAHLTGNLSPTSLTLAGMDWWSHLFFSPSKRKMLRDSLLKKTAMFSRYVWEASLSGASDVVSPGPADQRFKSEAWHGWPFNIYHQGFLLLDSWWREATTQVRGVSQHHEDVVCFIARQWMDMISPSNFPLTNPGILKTTQEQQGRNFITGLMNFIDDASRFLADQPPVETGAFVVGQNLAVTKGKVIYQNHLFELIQYTPTTASVYAEPVLIVPAWIMKYYILDLQPHNSLVKYLVDKGHTVFMMSWRNPDACDRDIGLNDYLEQGLGEALKAVRAITGEKIHATGYCLGGTLLAMMAAKLARDQDDCLQSVSLFAAQTDFEDPGEINLFIDESQIAYLEDVMWKQGYLDKFQMASAFEMLRSNDLIWSRMINEYMQGQRPAGNDLMAWNADATRMPYRMHSEYLKHLFMDNDLAEGRYVVDDETIALKDITVPVFAVGTVRDHVAPWKSVYKIHILTGSDVTFVLTSGGHNAGIISEPGHKGRSYQMSTSHSTESYLAPEMWQNVAASHEGSWWDAWQNWLAEHSGKKQKPPAPGNKHYKPLCDAPGEYVFIR